MHLLLLLGCAADLVEELGRLASVWRQSVQGHADLRSAPSSADDTGRNPQLSGRDLVAVFSGVLLRLTNQRTCHSRVVTPFEILVPWACVVVSPPKGW